jgi:hypothetical protein
MKEILPSYFSSEWSFASFRVPESRCIVCFGQDTSSIIGISFSVRLVHERIIFLVVCADGTYYKYSFDASKGGECKQEATAKFLKS